MYFVLLILTFPQRVTTAARQATATTRGLEPRSQGGRRVFLHGRSRRSWSQLRMEAPGHYSRDRRDLAEQDCGLWAASCELRDAGYRLLASLDSKCWHLAPGPPWLVSPRSPQCSLYYLSGQEKFQRRESGGRNIWMLRLPDFSFLNSSKEVSPLDPTKKGLIMDPFSGTCPWGPHRPLTMRQSAKPKGGVHPEPTPPLLDLPHGV